MAEARVAAGYELLAHRWKTPFAEIDLLFQETSACLLIVEVKTWNEGLYGAFAARDVLTFKQQRRLERARTFVEEQSGLLVRFEVAVVSHRDRGETMIHAFEAPILNSGY